ncbi:MULTISPECIES: hypothetical protein [unclassified Arthrobacter]|uniref:hypothetical protein n=1 Tax=unclassified Arthrobacter TaxID=235627 RepID=UPI000CE54F47|nr:MULTISPECIES: hypothetical protein [unclassified Arthrobacter]
MDDGSSWELAIAFLPALMTAGLTTAGFWFSERRKDKDAVQQRMKAISEERNRVLYLRTWLETYGLVVEADNDNDGASSVRREVSRDLVDSRDRLSHALQPRLTNEQTPSVSYRALRRALLLPLKSPSARAFRWGYWLFLALSVLFTLAIVTSGYESSDGTPAGPATVLATGFVMFSMFFAIALIFRAMAAWLDRRYMVRKKERLGSQFHVGASNLDFPITFNSAAYRYGP